MKGSTSPCSSFDAGGFKWGKGFNIYQTKTKPHNLDAYTCKNVESYVCDTFTIEETRRNSRGNNGGNKEWGKKE